MTEKELMLKFFKSWPDIGFGVHADYFTSKFLVFLEKEGYDLTRRFSWINGICI